MTTNREGTTRRGFMAACGAVAAATALPAVAIGEAAGAGAMQLPAAAASWPSALAALAAQFRPAYLAEVIRFTKDLRPRFEAGELYGYRGDDTDGEDRLETLCAERFGLRVEEVSGAYGYRELVGDETVANMINAVSPSAEHWEPAGTWDHPSYCAQACAAFDVLAVARALGYYEPTSGESPSDEATLWAREVLS